MAEESTQGRAGVAEGAIEVLVVELDVACVVVVELDGDEVVLEDGAGEDVDPGELEVVEEGAGTEVELLLGDVVVTGRVVVVLAGFVVVVVFLVVVVVLRVAVVVVVRANLASARFSSSTAGPTTLPLAAPCSRPKPMS